MNDVSQLLFGLRSCWPRLAAAEGLFLFDIKKKQKMSA